MPSEDTVRNAKALRLRFLNALYDREQDGVHMPFTEEISKQIGVPAGDWHAIGQITGPLKDDGLIDGAATDQHGLIRVRLTGAGRRLVESKAMGNEPPEGSPASVGNIRIAGDGNVINIAQHSANANLHAEITPFDKRQMLAWADDVERRAKNRQGMQPEDLEEIHQQVGELRSELDRTEPDPSKVRTIGKYIVRILSASAAGLVSGGLVETGKALFF